MFCKLLREQNFSQRGNFLNASQHFGCEVSRGFEPRSPDSESRVLTVTPRDRCQLNTAIVASSFPQGSKADRSSDPCCGATRENNLQNKERNRGSLRLRWEVPRHCVRAAKEMESKSIGLCPQALESPRCRFRGELFCIWFPRRLWTRRQERSAGSEANAYACVLAGLWLEPAGCGCWCVDVDWWLVVRRLVGWFSFCFCLFLLRGLCLLQLLVVRLRFVFACCHAIVFGYVFFAFCSLVFKFRGCSFCFVAGSGFFVAWLLVGPVFVAGAWCLAFCGLVFAAGSSIRRWGHTRR